MKLHFQKFGSGFPLVILHGLFGSSDNWQSLSKRLGQTFTVYAVDLRNHGDSPHADEFDYDAIANDLAEFCRDQQLTKIYLLGHSMGGKAAMQFAIAHSDLVAKLIVVDIAPKPYARSHDYVFDAVKAIDPKRFATRTEIDRALANQIPDIGVRQFLLKSIGTDANRRLYWKINWGAISANYEKVIDDIPAVGQFVKPSLFIRGGKSSYVEPADETLIRSRFPNVEIVTIAKADHWVHADAPNEFLDSVLSFLQR